MCDLLSVCCYYPPLFEVDDSYDEPIGLCSNCKDNTTFEKGESHESCNN
tara:strand:+ start:2787 stop:2933 length:147 start_codon:yes stop_codon:yes gene_type:complete